MYDPEILKAGRVCFFSHFDVDGLVDDYVFHYLGEIKRSGFLIVFVSTAVLSKQDISKLEAVCADVILRENRGLDFGGWSDCLRRYSDLSAEFLMLCNDSVYGPFWSLSEFIDTLTAKPADFYGAVASIDQDWCPAHLQSWFLLFRPAAYNSRAFRERMRDVDPTMPKMRIVKHYECGLTPALEAEGLRWRAAFAPREQGPLLSANYINPIFTLWRELLERRKIPFIKIGLLRDRPAWAASLTNWAAVTGALDRHATALAERNLARRMVSRPVKRFERTREYLYVLSMTGAMIPSARPLLIEDMDLHGGRPVRRAILSPETRYSWLQAARGICLFPFRFVYKKVSQARHGAELELVDRG